MLSIFLQIPLDVNTITHEFSAFKKNRVVRKQARALRAKVERSASSKLKVPLPMKQLRKKPAAAAVKKTIHKDRHLIFKLRSLD